MSMTFTCEHCGWWADINGVSVCGYSGRPTVRHDSCEAWKTTISTNADRIRGMTDAELTRFFAENCGCDEWCMHWRSGACASKREEECCLDVWYDWLIQEADK